MFGAWTFVGALSLASRTLTPLALGRPLPPPDVLASVLVSVWLWALMTPAIFALTERFPLDGTRWWRPIGPHLLLCAACWFADVGAGAAFGHLASSRPMPFAPQLFGGLFGNVFSYLGVLAVGQARRSHRISVERQVRASELESELLRSRLLALQMQLRPHFLFNALNTVSGLIRVGNHPTALQTVAGLADLLRAVLQQDGSQEVPLRDELEFIEQYLQIEGLRFQDRLRTRFAIEPEALDALVPQLLLQPLVENAVRHGSSIEAESRVEIHARREAGMLRLEVRDSGVRTAASGRAVEDGSNSGSGIGLSNTRARLAQLYGERHRLSLTREDDGDTVAEIAIPFRRFGEPEVSR